MTIGSFLNQLLSCLGHPVGIEISLDLAGQSALGRLWYRFFMTVGPRLHYSAGALLMDHRDTGLAFGI